MGLFSDVHWNADLLTPLVIEVTVAFKDKKLSAFKPYM